MLLINRKFTLVSPTMKNLILALAIFLMQTVLSAQNLNVTEAKVFAPPQRLEIKMPHLDGYQIIKADFHMHTVFSDGTVWPTVRVREAWRDGLDAIAISDHVELRPKREYISHSLNMVHEIALPEAERLGIILIKAAEITRRMPPGHLNALFLTNIDELETDSWQQALETAQKQGAFIFWNHPGWRAQQPDTCRWFDEHEQLYRQGLIHGIEVYNFNEWYPVALDWCRDKNLAFIANTDIHEPMPYFPAVSQYLRPMTLVIAREKTSQAIKEAMFNRQTVAFFAGMLAGPQFWLEKIFFESIKISKPFNVRRNGSASVNITNLTDIPINLLDGQGRKFILEAQTSLVIPINNPKRLKELPFTVTNFLTGTHENLKVNLPIIF